MSPVSRLLSHISCLTFHVSCLMSPVSHILAHVSCLTSPFFRLLHPVSCLMFHVSRILSLVSCLTFSISCLTSPISCLTSPISCLLTHFSCILEVQTATIVNWVISNAKYKCKYTPCSKPSRDSPTARCNVQCTQWISTTRVKKNSPPSAALSVHTL